MSAWKEGKTQTMDLLTWLTKKGGITAGLTMEFFAGRGVINRNTAEIQIELVQKAIDSLAPGYEMKSLAWIPTGKDKGVVGPFDRPGWNWQRKGISRGQYRKHAVVGWKGEDQQDFFVMATERTAAADSIRISTSLKYVAALCEEPELVEKLVQLARDAWAHLKLRYAYANLGITDEGSDVKRAESLIAEWRARSNITLSDVTPSAYEEATRGFDKKVRGAYWFNILGENHIKALGGIEAVESTLPEDIRIEEFKKGGVLIQLTPMPNVEDSPENQSKFAYLSQLLEPIIAK